MKIHFMIFIMGNSPNSRRALHNLEKLCELYFKEQYTLSVIDILKEPRMAEDFKIFATPTVIKVSPPPLRRIVGDLTNFDEVINGLDLVKIAFDAKVENSDSGKGS